MIESLQTVPQAMSLQTGFEAFRARGVSEENVKAAAKEFEAVFMAQMIKPMWEGVETDGLFGGGAGEDAFRQLLIQEYGKAMAEDSSSGLSDAVMKEMIRLQEKANGAG